MFAWSTFLNGLVAIGAGIIANFVSDHFGYVAPFMAALIALIVAFFIISSSWNENYGEKDSGAPSIGIAGALRIVLSDKKILYVGLMQTLFESAMYSFVFLWSPVFEKYKQKEDAVPYGIIFSAFMVSLMIGSVFFKKAMNIGYSHENLSSYVFILASVALFIPCFTENPLVFFIAFNLFELCCGMYFPTIGTIRSQYVPEETRSTIMNLFRIPLNLLVVISLRNVDSIPLKYSFYMCGASIAVSYLLSLTFEKEEREEKQADPEMSLKD